MKYIVYLFYVVAIRSGRSCYHIANGGGKKRSLHVLKIERGEIIEIF